jgi:predicted TIM-barrel fold metal-dependent hydrolase
MAPKLAARNLHVQMLMHAHLHVEDLATQVAQMPVEVCFDHIDWPDLSLGMAHPGVQTLCRLLAEGQGWVKLSGLYRLCNAPYDATDARVAALAAANSERCLWGSDWPHIMHNGAQMPQDCWMHFTAWSLTTAHDTAFWSRIQQNFMGLIH